MISITVHQLHKRFGTTAALRGVDLRIAPGELFFLLGPSGCGKTTLLRCLAGFYTPEEGSIRFGEDDITRVPPHKRNTGMVFQSYALWPHMTVAENVAFGLQEQRVPREETRRRALEALESVRMAAYADRKPNQLSGGQQQRVALARALAVRPRCLLLDEPLSNLDAKLRLDMRGEIRRVCKEFGLTAVYVTHDQKEALSIADRMAVLEGGEVRQIGSPQEVYRRPLTRSVAHFIGEANFIEGTLHGVDGDRAIVETRLGRLVGTAPRGILPPGGAPVTVIVRPECWRLSEVAASCNTVPGSIGEAVYLGELAQYAFNPTAGGEPLKVFELNPRFTGAARPGLHAHVDPDDVIVVAG